MTDSRVNRLILAACLLLAGAVRVYGITYGPSVSRARPDEEIFVQRSMDLFDGAHVNNIYDSGWPEGFFRVWKWSEETEAAVLSLWNHKSVNMGCLYALNPGAVELPVRLVSVLCDLLSCFLGAAMVRRLMPNSRDWLAIGIGALAFACNYLLARNAHFGVSNSALTLMCTLCLYGGLRAAEDGPHFLPLAAAAAGAGFSIKYSGFAMGGTCGAAALMALIHWPKQRRTTLAFIALSIPVAAAAFWLVSPHVITQWQPFIGGLKGQSERYSEGAARGHLIDDAWVIPPGWKFHLLTNLPIAFGTIGLAVAGLGLLWRLKADRYTGIVLWGSALTAFGMIFSSRILFVRYAAPMIPALAVALATLLVGLTQAILRLRNPILRTAIPLLLVGLTLGPPLARTLRFDHLMAQPDTRDLAARWLKQHGGSAMAHGWYAQVNLLEPGAEAACAAEVPAFLNPGVPVLASAPTDEAKDIARGSPGWGGIVNDALSRSIWYAPAEDRARWQVYGVGLLPCGREGRTENHPDWNNGCYVLRDVISPGTLSCDSHMDLFDAFFLPYDGFDGQVLPGPRLEIHENTCLKPKR